MTAGRPLGKQGTVVALHPSRDLGSTTDGELVLAGREGDRKALETLYFRYSRMVNGLVFRLHPRDGELDDLVQDVFVIAFESLGKIQNPQAFAAFVGSIAVRTTLKRIRRQAIARRIGLGAGEPLDVNHVVSRTAAPDIAAEARRLYRQLERLAPEERVALLLRKVEGLSLEEIAGHMKLSLATVKRRITRAEARLEQASRDDT